MKDKIMEILESRKVEMLTAGHHSFNVVCVEEMEEIADEIVALYGLEITTKVNIIPPSELICDQLYYDGLFIKIKCVEYHLNEGGSVLKDSELCFIDNKDIKHISSIRKAKEIWIKTYQGDILSVSNFIGIGFHIDNYNDDRPKPMDITTKPGSKVRFDAYHGHDSSIAWAKQKLAVGGIYEVENIYVGQSSSDVYLKGIPGSYNTVMFSNVEGE